MYRINRTAAELARKAADDVSKSGSDILSLVALIHFIRPLFLAHGYVFFLDYLI